MPSSLWMSWRGQAVTGSEWAFLPFWAHAAPCHDSAPLGEDGWYGCFRRRLPLLILPKTGAGPLIGAFLLPWKTTRPLLAWKMERFFCLSVLGLFCCLVLWFGSLGFWGFGLFGRLPALHSGQVCLHFGSAPLAASPVAFASAAVFFSFIFAGRAFSSLAPGSLWPSYGCSSDLGHEGSRVGHPGGGHLGPLPAEGQSVP